MKLYVVLGALVALLGAITGAYLVGRHAGTTAMVLRLQKASQAAQTRQDRLITQLQEAQAHEKIVTRTRIEVVRAAQAKCLDTRMPGSLLGVLPGGLRYRQPQAAH